MTYHRSHTHLRSVLRGHPPAATATHTHCTTRCCASVACCSCSSPSWHRAAHSEMGKFCSKADVYEESTTQQVKEEQVKGIGTVHTDAVFATVCFPGFDERSAHTFPVSISAGDGNTIAVCDWKSGTVLHTLRGHTGCINALSYHEEKRLLASASRDVSVKLWDVQGGKELKEYNGHELSVSAVALNSSATQMLSGSRDSTLKLWDVESGDVLAQQQINRNIITCAKYFPHSPLAVQCSEDLTVRVWDTREGLQVAQTWHGLVYLPRAADINADGTQVVTCCNGFDGNGCEVKLWDSRTGTLVYDMLGHKQSTLGVCFLRCKPDRIVSVSQDCTVKLWDSTQGQLIDSHSYSRSGGFSSCSTYGRWVLASTFLGALYLFEVDTEQDRLVLREQSQGETPEGMEQPV